MNLSVPAPRHLLLWTIGFGLLFWASRLFQVANLPFFLVVLAYFFAAAATTLMDPLRRRAFGTSIPGPELLIALFLCVWALLSALTSEDPLRAMRVVLTFFFGASFMLYVAHWTETRALRSLQFLRIMTTTGIVIAFAVLVIANGVPPLKGLGYGSYRFRALFEGPIQLAMICATLVPAYTAFALLKDGRFAVSRRDAGLLIALFLMILASAGKFAIGVGIGSFVLVYFVYLLASARSLAVIGRFVLAVIALTIAFLVGLEFLSRTHPVLLFKMNLILEDGVTEYQSIQARLTLWRASLDAMAENPILGVGAGTFVNGFSHSHNVVLDYARGMGLPGAAAIVLLCLLVIGRLIGSLVVLFSSRNGRERHFLTFALFMSAGNYVVLSQLSDSFGLSTSPIFWMCYITAISLQVRVAAARATGPSGAAIPG